MPNVMKNSGFQWIGDIPQNWEMRRVKWCFCQKKEKAGIEDPTVLSLARDGIKVRDISTNEGQLAADYTNYNPVEPGDLLLNPMDLYSGDNCNISKISGVISPAYVNLKTINGNIPEFYNYYFKTQYWTMAFFAHGKGVSFENRWTLTNETLRNYPVVLPNPIQQKKIADYLDEKCGKIDGAIENQKKIIEKLKEYKQSLITEIVTKGLNPNVKMKDSGIEWIGQIPEHWGVTSIKNVIKGIKDGTHGTFERVSDGEYLLSAKNVFEDGIHIEKNESLISTEDYNSIVSNGYPKKGDILVCCVGTIGRCCIYKEEKSIAFQRSVSFLRTKNIISNKFLLYLLKSNSTQIQLNQMANASAQAGIYMGALKNIKVVFVDDYEEQEMIAEYLDKKCSDIDKAIADKEKLIEKFTEYKKSLIYECVTGKKEIV